MKRPSRLKSSYAYLLLFVMSLTLTLFVALIVSALSIFSPTRFYESLTYVRYEERASEMAKQEAIEIGFLYGVERDALENLGYESFARRVIFVPYPNVVMSVLESESILFEQDVYVALEDYAMAQGLSLTFEVQDGIKEMTQEVVEAFKNAVAIPLHQSYFDLLLTFERIFYPNMLILLIVLLLQQQILYWLDRRNHMRNLAYAFGSSAWMMILIPSGLLLSGFYRRIMIYPDYFRDLLSRQFEVVLLTALIAGGLLMVLGIISFVLHVRNMKPVL
jgi:hypothetical protein